MERTDAILTRDEMEHQLSRDARTLADGWHEITQAAKTVAFGYPGGMTRAEHEEQSLADLRQRERAILERLPHIERRARVARQQLGALSPRVQLTEAQQRSYNGMLPAITEAVQLMPLVRLAGELRTAIFENDLPARLAWAQRAQARVDEEEAAGRNVPDDLKRLAAEAMPQPEPPAYSGAVAALVREIDQLSEEAHQQRQRVTEARVRRGEQSRYRYGTGAIVPFPDQVERRRFDRSGYYAEDDTA